MTTEGDRLKAAGIEQTSLNPTGAPWRAVADEALFRLLDAGHDFTSEHVTAYAGQPPSPNMVGALINGAARRGLIVRSGYVKADRANQHSAMISTWQPTGTGRAIAKVELLKRGLDAPGAQPNHAVYAEPGGKVHDPLDDLRDIGPAILPNHTRATTHVGYIEGCPWCGTKPAQTLAGATGATMGVVSPSRWDPDAPRNLPAPEPVWRCPKCNERLSAVTELLMGYARGTCPTDGKVTTRKKA